MARGQTKVKVSVEGLLAAVVTKRAKVVEEYDNLKKTYDSRVAEHREGVIKSLREKADQIAKTKILPDTDYSGYIKIKGKSDKPTKPVLNTAKFDKVIATLKIAAEDTILITTDDYAEFLG